MPAAESSRRASAGHPYARQSASPTPSNSDEVDESSHVDDANMDDATRAKVARKEARIIRNRESAQRSRNQRKAHVAKLEERVKQLEDIEERLKELEEENAFLRSSSSSSGSPPRSLRHGLALSERGASPALSVASSALLPYTGGGVNLAAVAPPPRDLDMEVDVKPTLPPLSDDTLAKVQGENAALRDRVARLEELVKHLTPLISLSLPPPTTLTTPADPAPVAPAAPGAPTDADAFDITAFLDQTTATTTITTNTTTDGLSTTLSPPSGGDLPVLDWISGGPAAGEVYVGSWDRSGQETDGDGGEGRHRLGQTPGVPSASEESALSGWANPGSDIFEVDLGEEMEEGWDEGMRRLLEELETRHHDAGVAEGMFGRTLGLHTGPVDILQVV